MPRHPECGSHSQTTDEISKSGRADDGAAVEVSASPAAERAGDARARWGGARPNSGGARAGAGRKPNPKPAEAPAICIKPLGPRWHCVQTWPRHERLVAAEIEKLGLTVHLPEFARITTDRAGQDHVTPVPLFPGYLFARFDAASDPWRCIARLPGVACLFSVNERPIPLPVGTVERLIAAAGPDGAVDRDADPALPLPTGTMVRIDRGPFAGLLGLVDTCDRLTARVLLRVLGRHTPVQAPRQSISPV